MLKFFFFFQSIEKIFVIYMKLFFFLIKLFFLFSIGIKFFQGVQVLQIPTENLKVSQVQTSHGTIKCEYFVNCAGMVSKKRQFFF